MGLDYLGPIILVTCLNTFFGASVPCNETYLNKNCHRCYPCCAGYHKVSDCDIDGEQFRCKPCRDGYYMPTCDNSTKCKKCDQFCHGRQIKIKPCTATSDIMCQCKEGYFWKKDPHRFCTRHSNCIPGEGLKTKGTPNEYTKCEPCKHRLTYSKSTSLDACAPCSLCNITLSNCNVTQDSICENMPEVPPDTKFIPKDVGGIPWVVVIIVISVSMSIVMVAGGAGVKLCVRRSKRIEKLSCCQEGEDEIHKASTENQKLFKTNDNDDIVEEKKYVDDMVAINSVTKRKRRRKNLRQKKMRKK